ncbi:unnamed protein product [Didymodactylos carnosus]|uniref:DUF924 domain-containing protein n=1 Tax=Didymodactylos carnosus TaxID=1234261 RepID=A0A814PRJ7_9BILA|nr:unnamed protein product [Didymodactylos carnosus]CAF1109454.1 unnamed protein product [Didymodactylos carnosus]CAF3770527.1 unnamed protein product [Didymodactylos carnosus]CAF3873951.1 unnamed protein product [Didymodactylos carnosus]
MSEQINDNSILYQLVNEWYGALNIRKPLSSGHLSNQWLNLWFAKGEQQIIVDKKLLYYRSAIDNNLNYKPTSIIESMGMIILYDQITRNIFRGSDMAYKYDEIARNIALDLVKNYEQLPIQLQITIVICLIHSENIDHHLLVKNLIENYISKSQYIDQNVLSSLNGIAKNHFERISLFARIPERNQFLNRTSTEQEIAFMNAVNKGSL